MNKVQKLVFATAIALFSGIYVASAQIYVNLRPERPVVVRVDPPTPRHVWIDEDWEEVNGQYAWRGGRWEAPPHEGDRYRAGHWSHSDKGQRWEKGRWDHNHKR